MNFDLLVTLEAFEAAATESGGRVEITMKISVELDDAQALDMALKLLTALAAARGEGRP
jgi:hypothetical protein